MFESMTEFKIILALSASHKPMLHQKLKERIEQAINQYLKKQLILEIHITSGEIHTPMKQHQEEQQQRFSAAKQTIHNDTQVKQLIDLFDGAVVKDSIQIVD